MSNSESEDEHDDGVHRANWTKQQVRELMVGRKGFQAGVFMSSGFPPDLDFQQHMGEIAKEDKKKKRKKKKENDNTSITTTRTTRIQTKDGVISTEESVQIDHGAIRYATTINIRTGVNQYIPIKGDTGTEVNWISKGLVKS